jgi:hypothetical protein
MAIRSNLFSTKPECNMAEKAEALMRSSFMAMLGY